MHTCVQALPHTKGVKTVCLTRVYKCMLYRFSVYVVGKGQKDCWGGYKQLRMESQVGWRP